ncbi:ribonuclease H-like protein [Exidia glandulosa HHB12029]|uniref:ribonuclease H n=1 Tax=Exidia glandulosa HHB12029 TaxID=1314781 RepID=A0A165R3B0_EXIGL|nr:ribonuclease H-like protein [Exidia glandulosa HHB12029]
MAAASYLSTLINPKTREQGISDRRWYFCKSIAEHYAPHDELIRVCPACKRFFARCCQHNSTENEDGDLVERESPCHHFRVIYTDGACTNNGAAGKEQAAGMGIVMGLAKDDYWALPINHRVDPGAPRTSQRAELLAAIKGLELWSDRWEHHRDHELEHNPDDDDDIAKIVEVVLATDSEYVVKGLTQWYPAWKKKGWRAGDGKRPANLDLFHKLHEVVTHLEHQLEVNVGFLHLQRSSNELADTLAKLGAQKAAAVAS